MLSNSRPNENSRNTGNCVQIIDKGQYRYQTPAPAAQPPPPQITPAPADQGPHHLAQTVGRALSVFGSEPPPEEMLALFFSTLYEASFRGVGDGTLRGRVVWSTAPCTAGAEFLRLSAPVLFSVSSLTLFLAGAAVPPVLLVGRSEIHPVAIYGILSSAHVPVPSTLFSTHILGPAHLKVETGLDYPLELRRNRLRLSTQKVFEHGLVRARLSALFQPLFSAVQARLPEDVASSPLLSAGSFPLPGGGVLIQEQDWPETLEQFWVHALTLLLRRMDEGQRGGCVLLMPRRETRKEDNLPDETWLVPPSEASFSQLRQGLEKAAAAAIIRQVEAVQRLSERTASPGEPLPDDLILQEPTLPRELLTSDPQITGAIGLLASLAPLDGLLRLDPSLELISFGGQPSAAVLPERVYLAGDEAGCDLTPISLRSFGPRNQALLSLCRQNPDAVGFALTQDGDLRAMLLHDEKLIVWNTVLLPQS